MQIILQQSRIVAKEFQKLTLELTAAGLFRIFTGFPFHHLTEWLGEPMQRKDNLFFHSRHSIFSSNSTK
jgi:hypothetical protein